jgi:hypothetical protein
VLVDEEYTIGTIPLSPQGSAFPVALERREVKGNHCGRNGHLEDKCYDKDTERCDYCW